MSLRDEYLAHCGGDPIAASVIMARGLMKGDPATFKVGYTQDNAVLAVQELFELDPAQVEDLESKLALFS